MQFGVAQGHITHDEYQELINILERERRVATARPELYAGLLEDSMNLIPRLAKEAGQELATIHEELRKRGLQGTYREVHEGCDVEFMREFAYEFGFTNYIVFVN